jgi:hypothetical protein
MEWTATVLPDCWQLNLHGKKQSGGDGFGTRIFDVITSLVSI